MRRAEEPESIVIVGASLCGLSAAETLREEGYQGKLAVIGDENHEPYDRPPFSKQVAIGWVDPAHTALPRRHTFDVDWRLGRAATSLSVGEKTVQLANGSKLAYDKLLIATGARSRPWPKAEEAKLEGVLSIRTVEDGVEFRRLVAKAPKRVLVIGAGFTGSEIASACLDLGLSVTVIEQGAKPLHNALGGAVGDVMAEVQKERGVDLRCGVGVERLEGEGGKLRRAHLSDGSVVEADIAVTALGAVRNIEWLKDSGLAVGPWGVACDAGCRAFDKFGAVVDDVYAGGDVARFPHPLFDFQFVTLEHWGNAVAQGATAAHNMRSPQTTRRPHLEVPAFWSNQFGLNIKSLGAPNFADEAVVTLGSFESRRFVVAYGKKGRLCAALTVNSPRWLELFEAQIARQAPFPPDLEGIDRPTKIEILAADFPPPSSAGSSPYIMLTGHSVSEPQAEMVIPKN